MRAVVVPEAGAEPTPTERPVPEPGPDEVRIEVAACGVCGGDAAALEGAAPVSYPRVPGHEYAGRVDAVGAAVERLAPGDRVAVGWYAGHCGTCRACRTGDVTGCPDGTITGVHHDGGWAEYAVAPAAAVAGVPEGLSLREAGPLACAGMTAFNALRRADVVLGDTVAVVGLGGVGHLAVQVAAAAGLETVVVSGSPGKADVATSLGADRVVDTTATDAGGALAEYGGADLVLVTAPAAEAVESAVAGLARGGAVRTVAVTDRSPAVPTGPLVDGRRAVEGWSSGDATDIEDTLAFVARTGVEPVLEPYALEAAATAVRDRRAGEVRFRAVLEP